MGTNPIKRVSVISTGTVETHPQHVRSEGTPQMWWLLTSRRWTNPLPINVYVIEHENGLVLFDTGQDRAAGTNPATTPVASPASSTAGSADSTSNPKTPCRPG